MLVPATSTLSILGRLLQHRLAGVFEEVSGVSISVDTPAAVAKSQQDSTGKSFLNLFFYRIEPSGFYPSSGAHDPWYVRVRCLMTAFSQATVDEQSNIISGGEIDLRVLGEVLRYFNENPIIVPEHKEDDVGAHLQVVLSSLSSEEINQIWSTQGDVAYRPSLLYEIALLPIEPKVRAAPPLPVVAGGIKTQSYAKMKAARREPTDGISPPMEIGEGKSWVPALSFVTDELAKQAISMVFAPGLDVQVWVAGQKHEAIDFVWQHIDRGAWTVPVNGRVTKKVPEQRAPVRDGIIDPAVADKAALVNVALPASISIPPPTPTSIAPRVQLLLHAERTLPDKTVLRSNPLILTVTSIPVIPPP